jgi:hypothetical protein
MSPVVQPPVIPAGRVANLTPLPRKDAALDANVLSRWQQRTGQSAAQCGTRAQLLSTLAQALASLQSPDFLAVVSVAADFSHLPRLEGLLSPESGLTPPMREELSAAGQQSIAGGGAVVIPAKSVQGMLLAAPVRAAVGAEALVALYTSRPCAPQVAAAQLEWAAAQIALWDAAHSQSAAQRQLAATAALVELQERLNQCDTLAESAARSVEELARWLGCRQVMIGTRHGPGEMCRLLASAGDDPRELRSERHLAAAALMDETLDRARPCVWPPATGDAAGGLLMHRQFVERFHAASVLSVPLAHDGTAANGVLFVVSETGRLPEEHDRFLRAAARPLAATLRARERSEKSPLFKLIDRAARLPFERKGRLALAVAACLALLLLVPVPHAVRCDCELQPVNRRYVAAPFDAALEQSFVKPGDIVTEDQLLARIDGREIRWELAGTTADLQRASRERDGYLAERDFGGASISELEMQRLQLQTELLQHRTETLEIRSPIAGLVISGDLERAEGVPLTKGQTIFELAPLDRLLVEVAVPEDSTGSVATGNKVTIWLDAETGGSRTGTIARIHPRAELKDRANIFVAEVELDNADGTLRPGMRGEGDVAAGRCLLGWRLFHKPWRKLLLRMGW